MKRKVLALACTLALSAGLLAGCGSSTDTAAEAESTVAAVESTEAAEAESTEAESTETAAEVESKGTITVAATPVPHAEILEAAKDLMAAEGWDLEIVEFTDYVQPNEVVESGDVDANYFQHVNFRIVGRKMPDSPGKTGLCIPEWGRRATPFPFWRIWTGAIL